MLFPVNFIHPPTIHAHVGIKHGESLTQYNRQVFRFVFDEDSQLKTVKNRRVEDEMRIPVAEAMHTSRNVNKRALKREKKAAAAAKTTHAPNPSLTPGIPPPAPAPVHDRPPRKTEFDQKARTTRLNDIVQAPPNLTKLPRGATAKGGGVGSVKTNGIVSMAQKQRMEEERERAIQKYRELKELRAAA